MKCPEIRISQLKEKSKTDQPKKGTTEEDRIGCGTPTSDLLIIVLQLRTNFFKWETQTCPDSVSVKCLTQIKNHYIFNYSHSY